MINQVFMRFNLLIELYLIHKTATTMFRKA